MNSSVLRVAKMAFWIGIIAVALTHIYMLVAGLPPEQMFPHAILNLVAAVFILFGWLKR